MKHGYTVEYSSKAIVTLPDYVVVDNEHFFNNVCFYYWYDEPPTCIIDHMTVEIFKIKPKSK